MSVHPVWKFGSSQAIGALTGRRIRASSHRRWHARIEVGEQPQISRERVRQIENEALQKLRRLNGERLYAYHHEL